MLRIMIAVDGSEPSLDAVRHGVQLVRQGLQASLVLAHAQQEATLYELATQDPDLIARASVAAGRHLMEPAVALAEAAGVPYETDIGLGETAATLVALAERNGCDMIIIGALGQGGVRRALVGSVSREVARLSPVPVTIVKHPDPEDLEDIAEVEAEVDAGVPPLR
ncbi:universal stress protein [Comamonas endophytica]|uniref:Universal stress protein n=1 Tax=Comamonas endophytica TaxID=2949090 RepID=A0ABY6GCZ4_9BURK|nr:MULTISPECIES: universal stress protein [unclassified Acidovorax]MCD2512697.1 universal stress protein [Acidovorax sp. D4N7]UYG52948.1 universal stress protein [Acidovorax sp. 5MLIR]